MCQQTEMCPLQNKEHGLHNECNPMHVPILYEYIAIKY